MTLADTLYLGTGVFLAGYALLCVWAFRVTRSPAMLIVLALAAYWTLAGGLSFLRSKATVGGATLTYLEDRLFPVLVDGDYAITLLCYAVFLTLAVGVYLVLSKPASEDPGAHESWLRMSTRFAHAVLLAAVAGMTVAKAVIVSHLVAASGGASLYTATRTVQGSLADELRIYQYLNVTSSYALASGVALWVGFVAGRRRYRPRVRWSIWCAYGLLLVEDLAENALLGNRAVPLVIMGAIATGWLRWRFLASSPRERRPQAVRFVLVAVAGLLLIGAIGASRGGDLDSPSAVARAMGSSVTHPGQVVEQVAGSSERLASHMSLYGVVRMGDEPRSPLVANSYQAYAALVQAPADQVFTVHYVTAWWLRVGPLGVLLAGLSFGLVMALLQRLALAARGAVAAAFALPAAVLPAAALPVILMRSGPESLRAVLVELVVLPGLVCLVAWRVGQRAADRGPDASGPVARSAAPDVLDPTTTRQEASR